MDVTGPILRALERRRVRLGMSRTDLARRSGVSLPTVQRLLAGDESGARMDTLASLAVALGVEVRLSAESRVFEPENAATFRRRAARAKAERLARLVQGTMALEAEPVDADALAAMIEDGVHALLAGSGRRLWGEG